MPPPPAGPSAWRWRRLRRFLLRHLHRTRPDPAPACSRRWLRWFWFNRRWRRQRHRGGSAAGTGNTAAGRTGIHRRGVDVTYTLLVEFIEAARGTRKRIRLPEGRELEVAVPAGIRDGQKLRLSGQGMPGFGNAEAGDALVEVNVRPHPLFRADGRDILIDVPVTLPEAVLGAGIIVPTLDGPVRVAVPPGSSGGRRLRLKGRGMGADSGDRGDMFVVLRLVLPDRDDPALTEFVKRWKPPQDYDQVRRRAGIE
ncbi:J domain-containing protein [Tistrella bauzanensis]